MGLLHDAVNILNLDETFTKQKKLLRFPLYWVDLQDVHYPSRYCEPWALEKMNKRIQALENGITFIGNGNYHYVSYLLLSKIEEDFTLILFDHHTDMMESPDLISCGSWVLNAIRTNQRLKKVIIIGANVESHARIKELKSKVTILESDQVTLSRIRKEIITPIVYISIDKDVLRPSDAITNWDQGNMAIEDLLNILQKILEENQVVGVDVCGELPISPIEQFRPQCAKAIKTNELSNIRILNTLLAQKSTIRRYTLPKTS